MALADTRARIFRETGCTDRSGVREGRVRPHAETRLPVGLAPPDDRYAARTGAVLTRPDQEAMLREQVLDRPEHLHARGRQDESRSRRRRSRSASRWEDSTTVMPCSATPAISCCRNSRRASGSRLATGSSRIRSSGRFARTITRATWARCPPDSVPTFRSVGMASSTRRSRALGLVPPVVELAAHRQQIVGGEVGVQRRVLRDEAGSSQDVMCP